MNNISKKISIFYTLNKDSLDEYKQFFLKIAYLFISVFIAISSIGYIGNDIKSEPISYLSSGFAIGTMIISLGVFVAGIFSNRDVSNKNMLDIIFFGLIFGLIQFSINNAGIDLYKLIIQNKENSVFFITGAIFTFLVYRYIFSNKNIEQTGYAARTSARTATRTSTKKENKYYTSIHEAGHAILHAKIKDLPNTFEVNVIGKNNYHGFVRTVDEASLELSREKLWYMYMTLAGNCAEKYFIKDHCFGSNSDLKRWEILASRYLLHNDKHHFYSNPKTELELNHNTKMLKKLRQIQTKRIYMLFKLNESVMREFIDVLHKEKVLNGNDCKRFFNKIKWPKNITYPNL